MSITIYRYASSVKAPHELLLDFGVVVGFFVAMTALATRAYPKAIL
jgi:hypothetical protein